MFDWSRIIFERPLVKQFNTHQTRCGGGLCPGIFFLFELWCHFASWQRVNINLYFPWPSNESDRISDPFMCLPIFQLFSLLSSYNICLQLGWSILTQNFIQFLLLTHWGRDKMEAISWTIFSSVFSWMKIIWILIKFYWSLFLRVQLTIFQHWFR